MGCSACARLPARLGAHGHKDREAVRDIDGSPWWQQQLRKAFAALWQGNLEREGTKDKARREEHKIRSRSLAAVSPHWFLKTKQV